MVIGRIKGEDTTALSSLLFFPLHIVSLCLLLITVYRVVYDIGLHLFQFKAFDKDSGSNGKVKYTIISTAGGSAIPFTVETDTGIVSSTQAITYVSHYAMPTCGSQLVINIYPVSATLRK